VLLQWTASTTLNLTAYNVYRSLFSSGVCAAFGDTPYASTSGTATSYTDQTVTDGDTYCYGTTAVDANGESALSNIAQAQIPAP
jgi:fibronectin type 3 domain-containing protein